MNPRSRLIVFAALLGLLLVSLLGWAAWTAVQARPAIRVTVFAAASLTDAFSELAASYEAAHPGTTVTLNFAGSATLAAQINAGAPADLFASANTRQMDSAIETGQIADTPVIFAHNRLALIVPADNPAALNNLSDLARPGVLLVLAAPDVPVRVYTDTLLATLAADPAYGTAYQQAVLANVVSEETSVRQVVAKVVLGEADAGIVYASDVTPDIAADLRVLPIPDTVNPRASYPIALTLRGADNAAARAFMAYVLSPDGEAALRRWTLLPPTETE